MILALLACSGEPEPSVVPADQPIAEPAPARTQAFDYQPEGVELVPSLVELHAALAERGLQDAAARRAATIKYKPDVVVANIAAARTGAELGAFAVEASVADPAIVAERVARIRAGLDSIAPEGPASLVVMEIEEELAANPDPATLLASLDARRPTATDTLVAHGGQEILPLVAAGAWLQAYALLAGAMLDAGTFEGAHSLFYRPQIGEYFAEYTATVGAEVIPGGLLGPLEVNLQTMKALTHSDPMSEDEVRKLEEACSELLGML
ncbi:MAG: hypothetical protein GY913_09925 [Proteobacteria bacterium]|nr:hypothetical protein [Pseudomonadota bacterium]